MNRRDIFRGVAATATVLAVPIRDETTYFHGVPIIWDDDISTSSHKWWNTTIPNRRSGLIMTTAEFKQIFDECY